MQTHGSSASLRNQERIAKMWPAFVDIEKRKKLEVPFILRNLHKPDPDVFDSCLGCGATTMGLRMAGVERVVSNEIDPEMRAVALSEAAKRGLELDVVSSDWRTLPPSFHGRFDLVTCLGNSLTYLFGHDEQMKALRGFLALLSSDGILLIDERNYPRILEGRFSHSGDYVYCGIGRVACRPVHISDGLVVMEYELLGSGERAYLDLYPFKRGELVALMTEAGFKDIRTYGDYKEQFDPRETEFFTYAARR
ncbi:MAG: class I SAM-dependent methyltransferase [Candidatus Micrarchaeota archaeon]